MEVGLWAVVGIVVGFIMNMLGKRSGRFAQAVGMVVGVVGAVLGAMIVGPIVGLLILKMGGADPVKLGINAGTIISATICAALGIWFAARAGARGAS